MDDSKKTEKGRAAEVRTWRSRKAKLERVSHDITECKRATEKLEASEKKFKDLAETTTDWIWEIDKDGVYTYASPKVRDLLGYETDEIIGRTPFDFMPEEEAEKTGKFFREKATKEEPFYGLENVNRHKDGHLVVLETNGIPLFDERGRLKGYRGINRDITKRKRAEEELKHSKEFIANVLNALDDPVFVKDEQHRWVTLNDAAREVMGQSREKLIGKTDYALFPKEQADIFWERDNIVLETGQTDVNEEEITWHGKLHTISTKKSVFTNSATGKRFIAGSIRDITERKRTEEALRESEEKFRTIFDNTTDGILLADMENKKFLDGNKMFCQMLGYSLEEIKNIGVMDIHPEEDLPYVIEQFEKQSQKEITLAIDIPVKKKDGSVFYADINSAPITLAGKTYLIGVFRDTTERKKVEEKLLDYQRQLKALASQLTLAEERERYRIATELHDRIAQSLVVSKLRLETVRDSDSLADLAKVLNETAKSIEQIIQDVRLLTFELRSPILNELGFEDAVAEWLTEQIDKKHDIATEFEDDGQPKPLDDDILAVLFRDVRELLVNAVKHAHATKIKVSVCRVDEQICVSVEDNGVGFNPAKALSMAVRTGRFGLFSIREQLEELGGHLEIKSTPGHGTRTTVTAPLKQEK